MKFHTCALLVNIQFHPYVKLFPYLYKPYYHNISILFGMKQKDTNLLMINLIVQLLVFQVLADMGICAIDEFDNIYRSDKTTIH